MSKKITASSLFTAAQWAYDQAIGPIPIIGSALDLAADYLNVGDNIDSAIDSLIRWQCSKGFLCGFCTGLPGIFAAPASIPINITTVLCLQLRMVAAIAHMRGYATSSDQVKTLALICLCGSSATNLLRNFGIQLSQKLLLNAIKQIPGKVLIEINKAIGVRLLTKFGQSGLINLGKAIPIVGAFVGGTFDTATTYSVGKAAKQVFVPA